VRYLRRGARPRLYLNTFRGEPAISRFAWHFTATHRSSQPFVTDSGSGLHARVPPASPCPWVDHLVSGQLTATRRPFGLAFAPAPPVSGLTSRRPLTRRLILQKARRHPARGLRPAGSTWFQDLFHSPRRGAFHHSLTVLVRYRSSWVFSLGSWATLLPTGFRVSGGTHAHAARAPLVVAYGTLTRSGRPFHRSANEACRATGLPPRPRIAFNPSTAAAVASDAALVWAPPGSLAATTGILSLPRGT
jgi:hypothetical protein